MSRIVLVDDEEHILRGLKKLIERIGSQYQVIGAFDRSTDALQFLRSHPVDILISDVRMPEMDGLALAEQAKKLQKGMHCIILSGYSDFDYARNAMRLGVVDYLLKPVDDDDLRRALSRVMERNNDPNSLPEGYIKSGISKDVAYLKNEIETNYAVFDLTACAERLCKSRDYLSKLFKKETGVHIKDYLKEIRIIRAKELLRSINPYKIYEICEIVGFTDTVYFSKQFRSIVGMTPKEYQSSCTSGFPYGNDQ